LNLRLKKKGQTEFLVKWKGEEEYTWELVDDLLWDDNRKIFDAIKRFEESHGSNRKKSSSGENMISKSVPEKSVDTEKTEIKVDKVIFFLICFIIEDSERDCLDSRLSWA
jgi:hypothetical protein